MRFAREEDRFSRAVSHMLLSALLGERLQLRYEELIFRRSGYGKPYLDLPGTPAFNLSHSGRMVVCAVAHTEVGIDVERIEPLDRATLRTMLGAEAAGRTARMTEAETTDFFYGRWTLLESWLKAEGTGLNNKHTLETFAPRFDGESLVMDPEKPEGTSWALGTLALDSPFPERYALAVCRKPQESLPGHVQFIEVPELIARFRALL
nr:4'-phosphopantetheinyl transferase superfamily protein [Saccharibacillus deserti]